MMNCLCVVAPTDEDLLRYALDGEILPTEAEEHLGHCLICQQRLARYVSTNNFLAQNLYRSQCPDTITLLQYCHGQLADREQLTITSHLKICPLCSSDVAETRQLIRSSALLSDSNPFFSLKSQVESIVALPYRNARAAIPPAQSSAAGEHEVSIWPVKYQANSTELILQVNYNNHGGIALAGTLLSIYPDESSENAPTFVGVKAELYYAVALTELEECPACKIDHPLEYTEDPLFTALVDEPGILNFPSVPPGKYLLIVHLPDTAMVIEELCIIGRDQTRSDSHTGD
jgi:hypothetical protein